MKTFLGCFVLFGAPTIAAGLLGFAQSDDDRRAAFIAPRSEISPISPPSPAEPNADPYAGASLPM